MLVLFPSVFLLNQKLSEVRTKIREKKRWQKTRRSKNWSFGNCRWSSLSVCILLGCHTQSLSMRTNNNWLTGTNQCIVHRPTPNSIASTHYKTSSKNHSTSFFLSSPLYTSAVEAFSLGNFIFFLGAYRFASSTHFCTKCSNGCFFCCIFFFLLYVTRQLCLAIIYVL